MKHQTHRMMSAEEQSAIPYLYYEKKLSTLEIAAQFGQHRTSVGWWLTKHGYKLRTVGEAGRLRASKRHLLKKRYKDNTYGYYTVYLAPDSPYYAMRKGNRDIVLEHRLIMAQHLGRVLERHEIVHHLNGIRTDNRVKNLALLTRRTHPGRTLVPLLTQRIRELEGELAQQRMSL